MKSNKLSRTPTISLAVDHEYKLLLQNIAKSMRIPLSSLLSLALNDYVSKIQDKNKNNQ